MALSRIPVKFIINDGSVASREVQEFNYKFTQMRDKQGQISAETVGGEIKLTFKALNLGLTDLLRWKLGDPLTGENKTKSGTIEFLNTTSGLHMKTIHFTDAFCVEYEELWKEGETKTNQEKIILACKEIQVETAKFSNKIRWGQ